MYAVLQLAETAVMSQTGLPAVAVSVQVDLAVQVQNLRLQSLGESPQSNAVALTRQQLRPDDNTVMSRLHPQTNLFAPATAGHMVMCCVTSWFCSGLCVCFAHSV